MTKRAMGYTLFIIAVLSIWGTVEYNRQNSMSKPELAVLNKLLAINVTDKQITRIKLSNELVQKFPAVNQMYEVLAGKEKFYAFVVSPIGYRSPINMMVVIDAQKSQVKGIRVMQHDETPGYGDWLVESWFTDRFKEKTLDKYLHRVILEAEDSHDIIQITGATATSQAAINGVNAAIGIYREIILKEKANPVPLKVEADKGTVLLSGSRCSSGV
ncbi:MAG: FMN-binding protein [Syntrophomonadaceae bacterium]|nr:FMN-binding protein [Syntrophomonadaceae bacterium]